MALEFDQFIGLDFKNHALLFMSSVREGIVWLLVYIAIRRLNAYYANILQNFAFLVTIFLDFLIFGTILSNGQYFGILTMMVTLLFVIKEINFKKS